MVQIRGRICTSLLKYPIMSKKIVGGLAVALAVWLAGCDYGVLGKKTAGKIDSVDKTVTVIVGQARDTVVQYLAKTRDGLLNYISTQSMKEAHDLSVGLMQGVIGYLDSADNRDRLALFLDSVITHTAGAARIELIKFKDELLDPVFVGQLRGMLRSIMQELVLNPTENLLTLVLSDRTRNQLDKMLRMVVPAVLNDSAIRQVAKLREALLGLDFKKDIAGLVDTALLVANHRLDSTLRPTIHNIVEDNTSTIRKNAGWIIAGLVVLAIAIGLVVYFVQRKKVLLNRGLLRQVTLQIEELKKTGPLGYDTLTSNIKDAMQTTGLEPHMSQFLDEEHIRK